MSCVEILDVELPLRKLCSRLKFSSGIFFRWTLSDPCGVFDICIVFVGDLKLALVPRQHFGDHLRGQRLLCTEICNF